MENEGFAKRAKTATMKFIKRFLIIVLLLGIAFFSYMYWGVYERGTMAGKVLRISEKGMIFKTYEGKITLESFGALKGVSPIAETFDFSVEKSEKQVIQDLQQTSLEGVRVNLHFVKRYMIFPWRGDTKYFVVKVDKQ